MSKFTCYDKQRINVLAVIASIHLRKVGVGHDILVIGTLEVKGVSVVAVLYIRTHLRGVVLPLHFLVSDR